MRNSSTCQTYIQGQNQAEAKYVSAWHLQLKTMKRCGLTPITQTHTTVPAKWKFL